MQMSHLRSDDVFVLCVCSEVVARVREMQCGDGSAYRPDVSHLDCADFVVRCIQQCWSEQPEHRPDFKTISVRLKPMQHGL